MEAPERSPGAFEGLVETSERTEKELEPLRLLIFRMARVREGVARLEEEKLSLPGDKFDDRVRKAETEADQVLGEIAAIAEPLGQLEDFRKTVETKHREARDYYADQINASFSAVDVFLVANNFVRSVQPPASDVAEEIWQRCLEEDAAAHTSYRIACAGWRRGKERVPPVEVGKRDWRSFFDANVPESFGMGPLVAEWVPKWMATHYRGPDPDGLEPILQILGRQEPHYLNILRLRFFKDTLIEQIEKAHNDRAKATNDSISMYASHAALKIRKREPAAARLHTLGALLGESRRET